MLRQSNYFFVLAVIGSNVLFAQPPGPGPNGRAPGAGGRGDNREQASSGAGSIVDTSSTRLMAFDKDGDGKLSEDEITDSRLVPLFQRADANKDKLVTKDELNEWLTQEARSYREGGRGDGPGGGPRGNRGPGGPGRFDGGPGGPGGLGGGPSGGPGGPGGPGGGPSGRGGMSLTRPGQILADGIQSQLQLSEIQRNAIAKLQSHVDEELGKVLTVDQLQLMNQIGSFGPRGGRGGPEGGRGRAGNER